MQGFKSFPEKTRITFEKPITGIVGPNGSGKSNISDAVLWVMGEQSNRTLRSGKMEDVIFGGTQRRSQVGFAEVSLILDNTENRFDLDSSEVMITRRYYRSGESEYYINRTSVRLKDINELLMDTGLGREGYSIIGQGRISEILSTKSKDRRDIFEEAAGISKHRHKKEEAERKLQQTDENLLRIGDKISELEIQIEPLREQAEIARRYLLLRDELRGLEISVWLRELETLRIRADKAESDHITAKAELEAMTRDLEQSYEDIDALSLKVQQLDIEADSIRDLISSEEAKLSDLDSAIAVLKSRIESNTEQIERLNIDMQTQEESQGGVGVQISERENRLSEIISANSKLDDDIETLVTELENIAGSAGEYSNELAALLMSEDSLRIALSDKKSDLSALASQAQELYDNENAVRLELSSANERLTEIIAEYELAASELEKVKGDAISHGNVISGLSIRAQNRTEKAEKTGEQLERIAFELKSLESRRNMLAEMEKDYQGYSKAVKLIMQESSRGSLKNIHGTVAGLIKTGDRYTVAIEIALGGAMQNIIVDSEDDGKAGINLLKRRDSGRATFLPISTINGSILDEKEVSGDDGFEGIAIRLVEFDKAYNGIYANLLGRVIIADDINSAVRIAGKHRYRYKVVTLDGQVIHAGGSMTGGSVAGSSGVLSRANELSSLADRIEKTKADAAKVNRENSEAIREKNAAEYELEVARSEMREIENSLIRLESDDKHRKLLIEAAKENILSLEHEIESINIRIKANIGDTDMAKSDIITIENDAKEKKELIEEKTRGQDLLTEQRELLNENLAELRANRASLRTEYDVLIKTVTELNAIRDEISGNRERNVEAINNLKNINSDIRVEMLDHERSTETTGNQINEYRLKLTSIGSTKLETEGKRSSLNKDTQTKNQDVLNMERECSRIEQRKITTQMEERQIVDKLWETYELSRTTALSAAKPIENLSEAQKNITSLKRQISALGTPNIGAIDEFTRVNTRYTFLTSQRDDVEKAKSELLSIIDDITGHMREIFTNEFHIINESFGKTFKELFSGGNASLVLEDPDDVLNCGIEIQVQPPGKSLKTITLLSGGEKAFVAIAIYFAILTVRPPPFVVMDEIDAALDDANVIRFSSYMRRMSNNTQMIVISHKRATMEEADLLYGVTMQELGVSKILKVDLDEAAKNNR